MSLSDRFNKTGLTIEDIKKIFDDFGGGFKIYSDKYIGLNEKIVYLKEDQNYEESLY